MISKSYQDVNSWRYCVTFKIWNCNEALSWNFYILYENVCCNVLHSWRWSIIQTRILIILNLQRRYECLWTYADIIYTGFTDFARTWSLDYTVCFSENS